jgi:signal peptidase I
MARVELSLLPEAAGRPNRFAVLGAAGFALAAVAGLTWAAAVQGYLPTTGNNAASHPTTPRHPSPISFPSAPPGAGLVHFLDASMEPTMHADQLLVWDKLAYATTAPARGDIVMIYRPDGTDIVKRIIAIAGDRIQIADAVVTVNGAKLDEPYIAPGWSWSITWQGGAAQTVPPDQYFVMGDNRDHSTDSRHFGLVQGSTVHGRVLPRP